MKIFLRCLGMYPKESILAPLFKLLEASFELLIPLVVANIVDIGIHNGDKVVLEGYFPRASAGNLNGLSPCAHDVA